MPEHADTPKKCEARGAKKILEFLAREGRYNEPRKNATIAEAIGLNNEAHASRLCSSSRDRRTYGDDEPRGGYRGDDVLRLGQEQINDAVAIIEENDYEGHDLDSGSLRYEANLPDVSDRTLRRRLKDDADIKKYIARTEEELDEKHAADRVEFAKEQLRIRPKKEDYRDILFTDEFHYGQGYEENRHYIYRRAGTRNRPDCIRRIAKRAKGSKSRKKGPKRDPIPRNDEESKDVHFFVIAGYDFFEFYEYKPRNINGKMSSEQYIEEFLKPIVLDILKRRPGSIIEEDVDGSHVSKKTTEFKEKNGIPYYINARTSPDFSVVETIAGISKTRFRKNPRFTREDVRAEAIRSLRAITKKQVNNAVDSMPARYNVCLENKG